MGGKEGGSLGKQGGRLREFAGKKSDLVVLWIEGVTSARFAGWKGENEGKRNGRREVCRAREVVDKTEKLEHDIRTESVGNSADRFLFVLVKGWPKYGKIVVLGLA